MVWWILIGAAALLTATVTIIVVAIITIQTIIDAIKRCLEIEFKPDFYPPNIEILIREIYEKGEYIEVHIQLRDKQQNSKDIIIRGNEIDNTIKKGMVLTLQ